MVNGEKFPSLSQELIGKINIKLSKSVTLIERNSMMLLLESKKRRQSMINVSDNNDEWMCSSCDFPNPVSQRLCEFCLVHRSFNTTGSACEELKEGEEVPAYPYSEVSLWGVLGTLELLTDLAGEISF